MDIPPCPRRSHHQWADALAASQQSDRYVRYCVNRGCGLIIEGPWENPTLPTRLLTRRDMPPAPGKTKLKTAAKQASVYRRLFARDGTGCFYCRCPLAPGDATIDHYVPLSKGGTHAFANLRASCFACNNEKGSLDADVFIARLAERRSA